VFVEKSKKAVPVGTLAQSLESTTVPTYSGANAGTTPDVIATYAIS
jgi:hypothetical protein